MSPADAGAAQEAISYLYVGARGLESDYLATATFSLPRANIRHGWYANSIVLKPMADDRVFVSLMLVRNKRFDFNEHVAVAWATPHAADVSYKDTSLIFADPGEPHRLAIGMKRGVLSLYVDTRAICTTLGGRFVKANAVKWFQVRTETNALGYHGSGTVNSIALKRDIDASPKPFSVRCEWHGSGLSWLPLENGSFIVSGVFRRNEAAYVDGARPRTKCVGVVRKA